MNLSQQILAIGLLWFAFTLLAPQKIAGYVPVFPMLLAYPWARSVRALLISLGRPRSRLLIFALMFAIYFVCLAITYRAPGGSFLAPLVFVLMHALLVFLRKASEPSGA
jgi:hypothetical protein